MAEIKGQRGENNSLQGAVTRLETRAHGTTRTEAAGDTLPGAEGITANLTLHSALIQGAQWRKEKHHTP